MITKTVSLILVTAFTSFFACGFDTNSIKTKSTLSKPNTTLNAQKAVFNAGSNRITLIQPAGENLKYPIYIPYSEKENGKYTDKNIEVLHQPFLIAETEMTNETALVILQWAMKNGRLSTDFKKHNGVNSEWVKYGGNHIIDLRINQITYSVSDKSFSVNSGYAKYPFVQVSWSGAALMCNWLTEIVFGNTSELVYSGISEKWNPNSTKSNIKKKGFRLPAHSEYIFAARCLGNKKPARGSLAKDYIATEINGGMNILTQGLYWTPGRYASGAEEPYTNEAATLRVAVPRAETPKPTATKAKNIFGLYDISGNVDEWMDDFRHIYGANFRTTGGGSDLERLQSAEKDLQSSSATGLKLGMRLAKTL